MLYTEEGLYLEWKVVSSRVDTENQNLQTNQPGQHCSLLRLGSNSSFKENILLYYFLLLHASTEFVNLIYKQIED